ncbi:exonuclease sbcCD subunit D, partial [Pseudoalteromonas ruthenica]
DELCELISQLPSEQDTPPLYVRLRLNATETDSQFRAKIDAALAGKHVLFCGIERVRPNADHDQQAQFDDLGSVEQLDPAQLLDLAFKHHMGSTEQVPDAIQQCLAHVLTTLDEVDQS